MIDTRLQATLQELQEFFPSGVLCLAYPDTPEKLYYWWGDRTLCLGHTGRLAHGINMELEEAEVLLDSVPSAEGASAPTEVYGNYI